MIEVHGETAASAVQRAQRDAYAANVERAPPPSALDVVLP
jgi:hypothetical protein